MKKLLLLCLLAVSACAQERSNCFKLENADELLTCYEKLGDKNANNEEELERLSIEFSERMQSWRYSEKKDEIRNQTIHFAVISSKNKLSVLDDEKENASLFLAKEENENGAIYFVINKGVFNCRYNGCSISVKIDDGAIFNLGVETGENGTPLFLINKKQQVVFMKKLKKGKRMIVELPIYGHGDQQAKFNIEGLKWEHF